MQAASTADLQDAFYSWNGRTLKLVKKDANLGPYLWNCKQLVDYDTNQVRVSE